MQQQMPTKEDVMDVRKRFDVISKNILLDEYEMELDELRMRQQNPSLWNSPQQAVELTRRLNETERFIRDYNNMKDAVEECELWTLESEPNADDFSNALTVAQDLLSKFELRNIFTEKTDSMSCALKIQSGAGGTEAQEWAYMLTRMYILYCREHGFDVDVVDESSPEGDKLLKSATLLITGENAYGFLKCETGIHRLVRVSPYNAQGKRMTSFASVFVSPIVDDSIEVVIDKTKLTEELFKRSQGAGGQNNNKVATACRLKYDYVNPDTGETETIIVENHETRKQRDNRERAMIILKSILYKKEMDRKNAEKKALEDSKSDIGWGAQIRSYVFDDARVKDHRTGYEEHDVNSVMNGHIDGFIKAYLLSNGQK